MPVGAARVAVGFLERDEAAGELEQGEVVLVLLGPADEDAAVAVQPGVGGLHDPPPGAPVGFADACGDSSPRERMCAVKPFSTASACIDCAS